jgi:hypothetical protein
MHIFFLDIVVLSTYIASDNKPNHSNEVIMIAYFTITGTKAVHIGYNPEVGKEVYRVGDELVYTDEKGRIAGVEFIKKYSKRHMFLDGTHRKADSEEEAEGFEKDQAYWTTVYLDMQRIRPASGVSQ